ncbi:hypothetical protein VPK24_03340 [Limnothrix redekei LRLZ20PSL1]|uniref:Uncharacterized protein n=1 Tax=Limnothrix redekei LRLZ20PSL1 TaxID=3112953 RepID=A0ABW7C621_9CYAN
MRPLAKEARIDRPLASGLWQIGGSIEPVVLRHLVLPNGATAQNACCF